MNKWLLVVLVILVISRIPTFDKLSLFNDEGCYIYMARQVSKGFVPHVHFFFAHPPLFLLWTVPFSFFGIIGVRIGLLLIQVLIMIMVFKITNNPLACLVVLINPFAFRYTNYFLGFGSTTLLILLAYYYNRSWWSPFFGGLAVITRLFALFPLYALSLFFKRYHRPKYTNRIVKVKRPRRDSLRLTCLFLGIIVLPLALLCLLIPNFLEEVILYHLNSKVHIPMIDKLQGLFIVLGFQSALMLGLRRNLDKELLLMSLFSFLGVFMQKVHYYMYYSIPVTLLVLAFMKGLDWKKSALILLLMLPFSYSFIVQFYESYFNPSELLINDCYNCTYSVCSIDCPKCCGYELKITGSLTLAPMFALVNDLELVSSTKEPGGIIDTAIPRIKTELDYYQLNLLKQPHLFITDEPIQGYNNLWNYMNHSNYELKETKIINGHEIYVYKSS